MPIRISRTAIIPIWIIVFGLIALVGPPVTSTSGVFLLILWSVALGIVLVLSRESPPIVAAVLHQVEASREERQLGRVDRSPSRQEGELT